jgi:hypothetical protein
MNTLIGARGPGDTSRRSITPVSKEGEEQKQEMAKAGNTDSVHSKSPEQTGHSPGPWKTTEEYYADVAARENLREAAQELLEACKGLVRYAEAARYTAGMGAHQLARLEAAKAAIAKAEGK